MDFKKKAASIFILNPDINLALEKLDDAETIPDDVLVWEKFQNESVDSLLGYIEEIEDMLKEAYEQGKNHNIDQ